MTQGGGRSGPIEGWNSSDRYESGERVYYGGSIWEARRATSGTEPGVGGDAWQRRELLSVALTVSNVRRAQVVDRTTLGRDPTAAHREPYATDLVVGEPATILFDLAYDLEPAVDPAAVDFRGLLSGTTVVVSATRSTLVGTDERESAFDLGDLPATLLEASEGAVPLFDHRDGVHRALSAVEDPFVYEVEPPYFVDPTVTVVPGRDGVFGDQRRERSSPRRRRPLPLRLGFVGIYDPDRGANYGPALEAADDPTAYNPPTLEATVREAAAYVEATFPTTDVRAYVHEEPIEGADSPDFVAETRRANEVIRTVLEERDGPLPRSALVAGDGPIEAFDLAILVGPQDYGAGDYLSFNDFAGVGAAPPAGDRAVAVLESAAESDVVEDYHAPSTVAHEIAHRFTYRPYCDPPTVADDASVASLAFGTDADPDCEHADRDVHSVALDIDPETGVLDVRTERSFMAAGPGRQWVDQRLYQHLLESAFSDLGGDSSSNVSADVGERPCPRCRPGTGG